MYLLNTVYTDDLIVISALLERFGWVQGHTVFYQHTAAAGQRWEFSCRSFSLTNIKRAHWFPVSSSKIHKTKNQGKHLWTAWCPEWPSNTPKTIALIRCQFFNIRPIRVLHPVLCCPLQFHILFNDSWKEDDYADSDSTERNQQRNHNKIKKKNADLKAKDCSHANALNWTEQKSACRLPYKDLSGNIHQRLTHFTSPTRGTIFVPQVVRTCFKRVVAFFLEWRQSF